MKPNVFNWEDDEAAGSLYEDLNSFEAKPSIVKADGNTKLNSISCVSMENVHPPTDPDAVSLTPSSSSHSKELNPKNIQEGINLLNIRTKKSIDNFQKAFNPFADNIKKIITKKLNIDQPQPQRSYDLKSASATLENNPATIAISKPVEYPEVSYLTNIAPLSDASTIMNNIIIDKPFTFNNFRSYQQKEQLLVAALDTSHSSCIIKTVLFLRETLKHELFKTLIEKYPNAWEEYRYFLKALGQLDILKVTHSKSTLDQLLADYSNLLNERLSSNSIDNMDKLIKKYTNYKLYKSYVESIQIHADLLRYQLTLKEGQKTLTNVSEPAKSSPGSTRKDAILKPGENMMNTLRIIIYRHLETIPSIPNDLKRQFRLSDVQFEYLIVKVCCALKKWDILRQFFVDKSSGTNLFKSKTPTSSSGFDNISKLLKASDAPDEIIEQYLALITDSNHRIATAEAVKCYDYAFNNLLSSRNRQAMEEFSKRLPASYDGVHQKIIKTLTGTSIKWK